MLNKFPILVLKGVFKNVFVTENCCYYVQLSLISKTCGQHIVFQKLFIDLNPMC